MRLEAEDFGLRTELKLRLSALPYDYGNVTGSPGVHVPDGVLHAHLRAGILSVIGRAGRIGAIQGISLADQT